MNVIVINSSKTKPLEILRKLHDVKIYAITTSKYKNLYLQDEEVELVDDYTDYSTVIAATRRIVQRAEIHAVLAPTESTVPLGGFIRSLFDIPGMKFETSLNFSGKNIMKRRLSAAGIPVAQSQPLVEPTLDKVIKCGEDFGWPIIIKPEFGAGSYKTIRIDSPQHCTSVFNSGELVEIFSDESRLIAEQFIEILNEYHIDATVHHGMVRNISVSRYFSPQLGTINKINGDVVVDENTNEFSRAEELHRSTISALGLVNGVTHMEIFETVSGEWIVGEIAARPGGMAITDAVKLKHGVDLWDDFVKLELGIYEKKPQAARKNSLVCGWLGMPALNGAIRSITHRDQYQGISGVESVQCVYVDGQQVSEKINTAFQSTRFLYAIRSEKDLPRLIDDVKKLYFLEMQDGRTINGIDL